MQTISPIHKLNLEFVPSDIIVKLDNFLTNNKGNEIGKISEELIREIEVKFGLNNASICAEMDLYMYFSKKSYEGCETKINFDENGNFHTHVLLPCGRVSCKNFHDIIIFQK